MFLDSYDKGLLLSKVAENTSSLEMEECESGGQRKRQPPARLYSDDGDGEFLL